jgi:DNA-directed RNA polymerase omega subunit
MIGIEKATNEGLSIVEEWPGIYSRFQLVILAGLRSKQLLRGARPRIEADPLRRRNTRIALEELRRGLIPFRPDGPIGSKWGSAKGALFPAQITSLE